jgi:hypothetical protein
MLKSTCPKKMLKTTFVIHIQTFFLLQSIYSHRRKVENQKPNSRRWENLQMKKGKTWTQNTNYGNKERKQAMLEPRQ